MNKIFQVEVPESEFPGEWSYMAPHVIRDWVWERKLDYTFVGSNSSGTGYNEDGSSNKNLVYMIKNASIGDDVLFKMHFPDCKVYPIRE